MTVQTPPRTIEQRRAALRYANEIRGKRVELKRKLARPGDIVEVIHRLIDTFEEPPLELDTMYVLDLLRAGRGFGLTRAQEILVAADLSPRTRMSGITDRQRKALTVALWHHHDRIVERRRTHRVSTR